MKKWLSYILYIVVTLAVTYFFQWVLIFLFGGIRFIAADRPPGDIGMGTMLIIVLGAPLLYFIGLTLFFYMYRSLLKRYEIELNKLVPFLLNIGILIYLIRFTYVIL